jgi:hypothetical protein
MTENHPLDFLKSLYSYAVQLLENNISLSQVAMAVDSLMFGATDNVTELTKLSTQFLPAQVAAAVASGLNPTVYAAETLGLALAGGRGDTLSTHFQPSFATLFGSLSVAQFVSEVASLTGINATAIQGFVQNWTNFYSANPSATFGLPVTLAAYGAAFGDAVGVALLNPTANGTTALLVSEEQNALIDNAEGLYKAGIPLISEPPHIPLQGEAVLNPGLGGGLLFIIDWAAHFAADNYAELVGPALGGPLPIINTPSTFTLNTQHYATHDVSVGASGHYGNLCTLILGDSTAGEDVGQVFIDGYQTVHIVANGAHESVTPLFTVSAPAGSNAHLVISGSGNLSLGDISNSAHEGKVSVVLDGGTITDVGVPLYLGVTDAETIDASNAPILLMEDPACVGVGGSGVIILGGASDNLLQGSLGTVSTGFFTNLTTGVSAGIVGDDNITGGAGGSDFILGDGGADNIILPPNHSLPDSVGFGFDLLIATGYHVLAITNGADLAIPGFWGADPRVQTTIPELFPNSSTGGTSADMTTITGFHASGGDRLIFDPAAWNGASIDGLGNPAASGDLLDLGGSVVASAGTAQLSTVWANSSSNSSLNASDNVLLYAPAGGSPHNAQELAAQLHGASGAIVLPGFILPGQHEHILVAYDANSKGLPIAQNASAAPGFINPLQGPPVVHIADVDLVNTSGIPQSATFNLHVYASDMVSLTGVSLTSLTSENIHFFL